MDLHVDALVITARVANSNVHRLLVDDGSTVDIIYLDVYKSMGLIESELSLTTSPLYGFTGDHVIPRGIVKLAVMVEEHSRVSTIVAEFLIVEYLSVVNGIIGRLLLKALKVVTSIYHLTMTFLTAVETRQARGSQYDFAQARGERNKVASKDGGRESDSRTIREPVFVKAQIWSF